MHFPNKEMFIWLCLLNNTTNTRGRTQLILDSNFWYVRSISYISSVPTCISSKKQLKRIKQIKLKQLKRPRIYVGMDEMYQIVNTIT